ncbi:MAG: hypothetical protein ACKV22_05660 [Bryobacteraceae bacterium]
MSIYAKAYIGGVAALGLVLLAASPLISGPKPDWTRFAAYLALCVLASALKVRLPGIRGTCSLNFVVYLLAVAQLTLAETVYIVCAGTLVQSVWRTARRPSLVQVVFNVAAMVVSILPPFVLHDRWPSLPAMALAAGLFYTIDTALISTVIALTQERPLSQVWNACYLWTLPYYLVGAVVAASADASRDQVGWAASLLILPLMYMVYRHYRLIVANATSTEQAR